MNHVLQDLSDSTVRRVVVPAQRSLRQTIQKTLRRGAKAKSARAQRTHPSESRRMCVCGKVVTVLHATNKCNNKKKSESVVPAGIHFGTYSMIL